MANLESFGADRDDIEGQRFRKYKNKEGNTDRIGIVYEDPKVMFKGLKAHFSEKYFGCKSTEKQKEVCCTHAYAGNKPRYRIAAVIIVYDLITKDGKQKLKDYEIIPWIFGEGMYGKLSAADKEFPLSSHDIKLTCKNEEYQNMDIQSCRESIWGSNKELREKILKEAQTMLEERGRNLASDLSLTEIRDLLGVDTAGSEDAAMDVDIAQVVETT